MIQTINYKGKEYPHFQSIGNAAQFVIPFAKQVCSGKGYDIGCMKPEWSFPGSIPIDLDFPDEYHALNLPEKEVDYIFSSHCLEHIDGWVEVMDYWHDTLKKGGVLFLYLPSYFQEYWKPWNNRKHRNIFNPEIIRDYLQDVGYSKIFISGIDLNDSFVVMAEK
jgi:predicted SAM-dependent methyltransferase